MSVDLCRYERGGILKRCSECWCMCRWDSWALLALPPLSTSPFRAMLCMAQGGTRTTSTKSRWVPQSSGSDSAEALTSGFKSRLVPYACRARTIRTAKGLNWAHQQGPLYRFTKNQRFCDCSCFPAKVSGLVCVFNGHAELEFDQILIASCSLFGGPTIALFFFFQLSTSCYWYMEAVFRKILLWRYFAAHCQQGCLN